MNANTVYAGLCDGYDGACAVIDATQQALLDGVLTRDDAVAALDAGLNSYLSLPQINRDDEGVAELRRFVAGIRRPIGEVIAENRATLGLN